MMILKITYSELKILEVLKCIYYINRLVCMENLSVQDWSMRTSDRHLIHESLLLLTKY